jgi:hypothetical protein
VHTCILAALGRLSVGSRGERQLGRPFPPNRREVYPLKLYSKGIVSSYMKAYAFTVHIFTRQNRVSPSPVSPQKLYSKGIDSSYM